MESEHTIQINTSTDKANFLLHGLTMGAAYVGISYYAGSPALAAAALTISFVQNFPVTTYALREMRRAFPPTPVKDLPRGSKNLPAIVTELADKLHVRRRPVSLYVFEGPPPQIGKKRKKANRPVRGEGKSKGEANDIRKAVTEMFRDKANAAAYGLKLPGVLISRPLLNVLKEPEKRTVVAHELAHLAARHTRNGRIVNFPQQAASLVARYNVLFLCLSHWSGLLGMAAGTAAGLATEYLCTEVLDFDKENKREKAGMGKATKFAANGTLPGTLYWAGQTEIIAAWFASRLTHGAIKLIAAHYSRCNEYQADRIAAEATQDPEALKSTLQKISDYNVQVNPDLARTSDTAKNWVVRYFRTAKALFHSHPSLPDRFGQLTRIAEKLKPGPQKVPA